MAVPGAKTRSPARLSASGAEAVASKQVGYTTSATGVTDNYSQSGNAGSQDIANTIKASQGRFAISTLLDTAAMYAEPSGFTTNRTDRS